MPNWVATGQMISVALLNVTQDHHRLDRLPMTSIVTVPICAGDSVEFCVTHMDFMLQLTVQR